MRVLQLTVHLFPNIGGVETHLKDLIKSLVKRDWQVFVLAYQPLSTRIDWKVFERGKNLSILRIPWIRGFFERLVQHPICEFIYLVPGLFMMTPFIIIFYKPDILHAHGLLAAVSAVWWGKIFKIRTVISLHSLYSFPKTGIYHDFVKILFKNSDFILSLSKKSNEEIKTFGVEVDKTDVFTYWIDLDRFKKVLDVKEKLKWRDKFIALFVGRLIKEKGIDILLKSAELLNPNIKLVIIGDGPMSEEIVKFSKRLKSVDFLGRVDQDNLPLYYCAADCVIVPSTSEEGFGRVIIESLACGTPVIASKRGAISEAMDETVGKLIEVTPEKIAETILYFYQNRSHLKRLSTNSRQFAERRYSEKNVEKIIKVYTR